MCVSDVIFIRSKFLIGIRVFLNQIRLEWTFPYLFLVVTSTTNHSLRNHIQFHSHKANIERHKEKNNLSQTEINFNAL